MNSRLNEAKVDMREAQERQTKLGQLYEKEFNEKVDFNLHLKNLPDTLAGVDNELGDKEPRLRVNNNGAADAASVEEHEKVSADLDRFERKKRLLEADCSGAEERFQVILERWRPRAEQVMGRINNRFRSFIESIGCAGQVSLRIPDDPVSFCLFISVN